MQKEIITPTTNEYLLKIPKKYINKRIEIIISPVFFVPTFQVGIHTIIR